MRTVSTRCVPCRALPRTFEPRKSQTDTLGPPAKSNFDYAARLAETVLLGNVALRVGKRIEWDAEKMQAKNCPEAEPLITRPYRHGWTL